MKSASAIAHPNIAVIKYWGNLDHDLRIPANGSISITLGGLETCTKVNFLPEFQADSLVINGAPTNGEPLNRVARFLDLVRTIAGIDLHAEVETHNNFPMGTGIASSASAFAALALAASKAAGLSLSEIELSRLARRGSGSACRSIPGGFAEWVPGNSDHDSFAESFAPLDHWDLADCVAIVSQHHKSTGSSDGHQLADSSPYQSLRIQDTPRRLDLCRSTILARDFDAFAAVTELDSDMMHAVMQTSSPPLNYWQPATIAIIHAVRRLRQSGTPVCYTIDAGPNVHILCETDALKEVQQTLQYIHGIREIITAKPGPGAYLID